MVKIKLQLCGQQCICLYLPFQLQQSGWKLSWLRMRITILHERPIKYKEHSSQPSDFYYDFSLLSPYGAELYIFLFSCTMFATIGLNTKGYSLYKKLYLILTVAWQSDISPPHTRSLTAARLGDVALTIFADFSRSVPPPVEQLAPINRLLWMQFSTRSLSATGRLTTRFPFRIMSDTHMSYLIILCNVGRQKLGLNDNVKNQRR